jgi:hypothetical protein
VSTPQGAAAKYTETQSRAPARTGDPALASRLHARGRKLETALDRFNRARKAEGQVPELEDPERAQLHVWWLKLKAWVSQGSAEESVRSSLEEFDATVLETIDRARALNPDRQLAEALDQARADLENLDRV